MNLTLVDVDHPTRVLGLHVACLFLGTNPYKHILLSGWRSDLSGGPLTSHTVSPRTNVAHNPASRNSLQDPCRAYSGTRPSVCDYPYFHMSAAD